MKKIGVITTQYSPNYGALLQAFALQKHLKKIYGAECVEIVNYIPPHAGEFWRLLPGGKGLKNKALSLYLILKPNYLFKRKRLFEEFKKFIRENLSLSKEYYNFEELEMAEELYGVLICGSDQIWNITRHDDPVWFLYFANHWKNCKKIAYAPSVADKIPVGHEENLKNYLENLDNISVRESMDVAQLQKYTSKRIYHVCDPVFLLKPEEWEAYLPDTRIKEQYILCYFISTGDFAIQAVEKIRRLTGLKVVHVNVNPRDKFNSDYDIRTATPFEFVNYIKNAKYVCTNSFHCTAFSILFNKNFSIIRKQMANSRMESLLDKVGLYERFIDANSLNNLTVDKLETDYTHCNIQEFIEASKDYIKEAINYDK